MSTKPEPKVTDPDALYTLLALDGLQLGDQVWWRRPLDGYAHRGPWTLRSENDLATAYRAFRDEAPANQTSITGWARP